MTIDAMSLFKGLPDHLSERTRMINRRPVCRDGSFVLYWMHHAVRGHENPALDVAVCAANQLRRPVLVYQGLGGWHPYNSDRHHNFILEGAIDVHAELADRGIAHLFHLYLDPQEPSPIRRLMAQAAVTVTEDFPMPPFTSWTQHLAQSSACAFWVVDSACIVPMQLHKKAFERAYRFRQETQRLFQERLRLHHETPQPLAAPFKPPAEIEGLDLGAIDVPEVVSQCRIDHTVGPVSGTRGGSVAGYRRWEQFKVQGLSRYADLRNDAAVSFPMGVSRMSAYLHHGHVAPFRIAREAAGQGGAGVEKYLDELLIWRELAHNYCFFHRWPDRIEGLPRWAVRTLDDHRQDPREVVYPWETLAMGNTGNSLWDAAQASLRIHGELHNNLRMTWGKALLQWTHSPEEALKTMIDLNHRYALDGSDPNSIGGILWCLGLFDRPFEPEKKVIGRLRPRSTRSHAARLDLVSYAARVTRPAGSSSFRVAVIGAGLSGVVAAQTLAGHGHRVKIFEKARGAGGRMTTRRAAGYAFDHGAQYFTARDPYFQQRVDRWEHAGWVRPWEGRIRVIRDGQIQHEKRHHRRYVGMPGMSAVARHLTDGLDVAWSTRVGGIRHTGRRKMIVDEHGEDLGAYDAVVVSAPAEQSAQLLIDHPQLFERLTAIRMTPCWAVILAFDPPLTLPFDGAFIHDSSISWVARNASKPGRREEDVWVIHASGGWSTQHYELEAQDAIHRLLADFFSATQTPAIEPVFATAHRWRYAQVENPMTEGALWDAGPMIGACGDWCAGSRVEGAYLSGAAMAGKVLAHIYKSV